MRCLTLLFLLITVVAKSQTYFPPLGPGERVILESGKSGYCQERNDSLYSFLEEAGTKSFILLKDGYVPKAVKIFSNCESQ
jgi:hypothetical protein